MDRIETVILRMTDREVQVGLRQIESEDLVIFLRLCRDDRVKAKIYSNMASEAARYVRDEVIKAEGANPDRAAIPSTPDQERHEAVSTIFRSAAGERRPGPVIDRYDTSTVRDLIELLGKLAEKARWDLPSLAEDAAKIRHRLLRDGLRVIAREADAIRVEEQLEALAERHVQEEELVAKLVKTGLTMIFDSQVSPGVPERLTSMVPFLEE